MAARNKERQRRPSRALFLAALALVALFAWLLLLAGTMQSAFASRDVAASLQRSSFGTATASPTSTLPATRPANTPTATPVKTVQATATAKATTTATAVANTTPTDTGNGGGGGTGTGPTGPQSTEVALSQPTAGSSSNPFGGLSPSTFGANGLIIATTLGCIVALLGIIMGVIAFYALVQSGYGPFLRALALGNNLRQGRKRDGEWGGGRATSWRGNSGRGRALDPQDRPRPSQSRSGSRNHDRDGSYGDGPSGNRSEPRSRSSGNVRPPAPRRDLDRW